MVTLSRSDSVGKNQIGRVISHAWTIPTIDSTSNPSNAIPAMRKPELRLAASAI
jgi:hypothetical protein